MSKWTQRFEEHPINSTLEKLGPIINTALEKSQELNPEAVEDCERINQIYSFLHSKIDSVDPNLVPPTLLNNLNQQLQEIVNELNNFMNDENLGHLTNVNNKGDVILGQIPNLIVPLSSKDAENMKASLTSFRRTISQYLRNIEEKNKRLTQKVSELNSKIQESENVIQTQKGRLDTAISNFQQQFSDAEDKRRELFDKNEKDRNTEHSNRVDKLKSENEKVISEANKKFEDTAILMSEQYEELKFSLNDQTDDLISSIQTQKDKAEKLVYVISNTGMIGGYQKIANFERIRAFIWQGLAVISFAGLIGFALYAFAGVVSEEFLLWKTGSRVFVAITFGILAAYAARQGDKHEEIERKNRKMELELASIDPYLIDFPEEQIHKIKEGLASRMFGQVEPKEIRFSRRTKGNAMDIVKMIIDILKELGIKNI